MSSAHKPLWFRIAWSSFLSFGLLYLCVGVFVLVAIIRHHVREYNDMLFRLTQDRVKEYGECRGDISEMNRHFAIDVDEHGTENVFLLLSSPYLNFGSSASRRPSPTRLLHSMVRVWHPARFGIFWITCLIPLFWQA
jgi:hypothetical protein